MKAAEIRPLPPVAFKKSKKRSPPFSLRQAR